MEDIESGFPERSSQSKDTEPSSRLVVNRELWILREQVVTTFAAISAMLYLCNRSVLVSVFYSALTMLLFYAVTSVGLASTPKRKSQKTLCSFFLLVLVCTVPLTKVSPVLLDTFLPALETESC
eukprot:g7599.t1